jgi:DNA-binding NarL/FixJ family response regulator
VRDAGGPELLTPREAEVLELLQSGRSNAEIADALHVGIETVRTHARRVYRKLGVRFPPLGANRALSRTRSMTSRGTGSSVNSRVEGVQHITS